MRPIVCHQNACLGVEFPSGSPVRRPHGNVCGGYVACYGIHVVKGISGQAPTRDIRSIFGRCGFDHGYIAGDLTILSQLPEKRICRLTLIEY